MMVMYFSRTLLLWSLFSERIKRVFVQHVLNVFRVSLLYFCPHPEQNVPHFIIMRRAVEVFGAFLQ